MNVASGTAGHISPIPVAVIESSPILRQMIRTAMNDSAGFRIVNDGGEIDADTAATARVVVIDAAAAIYLGNWFSDRPVIVTTAATPAGSEAAAAALFAGAADVVLRPSRSDEIETFIADLKRKIVLADRAVTEPIPLPTIPAGQLAAVGAVTGAVTALKRLLAIGGRPALIATHLPAGITTTVAKKFQSEFNLVEAVDGQSIDAGRMLLAPGGRHLTVRAEANRLFVCVKDGPARHHGCPSIDLLFQSLTTFGPSSAQTYLLTTTDGDGLTAFAVTTNLAA